MLRSLLLGVDTEFPDQVSSTLARSNQSKQCTSEFNAAGSLLAVGCSDGAIAMYNFDTKAQVKLLKGHTKPVTCLRSDTRRRGRPRETGI